MNRVIRKIGNPYRYHKPGKFDTDAAALLPKAYQKFYYECHEAPASVHWTPKDGKYVRHENGLVKPVQNIPLPMKYPAEFDGMLLGGEAILKGFRKKYRKRRFPHFWIPNLKNLAVYSEILNQHIEVVGTDRVIRLINHHQGFDPYIMETKANDLRTLLPLKIKRAMIKAIHDGCPAWEHDPEQQQEILAKYKQYGDMYTPEEAEWFGYSFLEAIDKIRAIHAAEQEAAIEPLKFELRRKLIEDLKASGLDTVERVVQTDKGEFVDMPSEKNKSWISKLNPFGKK